MERPATSEIPDQPGSYQFRDRHGQIIYVGKAKSLRKRVTTYFTKGHHGRTGEMMLIADSVEWIVTDTEVESLMLEYSLIQKHKPRYNVRLTDDKSYPFLVLTRSEEWPAARVLRGRRKPGNQYFGPFGQAHGVRNTLDLLLKTFPIRTCTTAKFKDHVRRGRPCLLFDIEKCAGPCAGEVEAEEYGAYLDGMAGFFGGDGTAILAELGKKMDAASDGQHYELAAKYRDQQRDARKALERQDVISDKAEDFDLVAVHDGEFEASVEVMVVRKGRVTGRYGQIVEKVEDLSPAELIARLLTTRYSNERPPPEVLVDALGDDAEVMRSWLSSERGSTVSLRVPLRGAKKRLIETARVNAVQGLQRHRVQRSTDPNKRAQAIRSLQEALDLPEAPLRIECFDISTLQGTDTVASMVVLEDGLPRPSSYRRFQIRTVEGQDDFAAMEEAVGRRFRQYVANRTLPVEDRGSFAYPPSLLLIDGGKGQLGRALKVLDELGLDIPVAGLAKRLEEVFVPGRDAPIVIGRDQPALHLLMRVRDEAHRFAITYHRTLRGKRMVDSALDTVAGLGPARKSALLQNFGSLKRIQEATLDELGEIVPHRVANNLYAMLHPYEAVPHD